MRHMGILNTPVALGLLLAWGKVGFPALKQVSPKTLAYSTYNFFFKMAARKTRGWKPLGALNVPEAARKKKY